MNQEFSNIDERFAGFICTLSNDQDLRVVSAILSSNVAMGNSCVPLSEIPVTLKYSDFIGKPGEYKPIIMDDKNLYLHKYWSYENNVATRIKELLKRNLEDMIKEFTYDKNISDQSKVVHHGHEALMEQLFDDDLKKDAVRKALLNRFSIISGGPGTGKTTTIARLIYILMKGNLDLRVAITAPTGKASARITESIHHAIQQINITDEITEKIMTLKGVTLHRLLYQKKYIDPLEDLNNSIIPYDLVIVDEASMIDLFLMSKLFTRIDPFAKVIIIGDKDQLYSVEAGSVMNELCGCEKLKDYTTILTKSWRSKGKPGISSLSQAINNGTPFSTTISLFTKYSESEGIKHVPYNSTKELYGLIKDDVLKYYGQISKAVTPEEALTAYESFRILCATKNGPFGLYNINNMIKKILLDEALILKGNDLLYHGRPIMITKNDYEYDLFNGDSGVLFKEKGSSLRAYFHDYMNNTIRSFQPFLLPEHETSYAITIHKSQGSEFDKVFVVLPPEDNAILSRQLLYTAITRAKTCVQMVAPLYILEDACKRSVQRKSGLSDKILQD